MKKTAFILFLATATMWSCTKPTKTEEKTQGSQSTSVYQCPMDCEHGKTYDKPGKCPVCEMDLEKKK